MPQILLLMKYLGGLHMALIPLDGILKQTSLLHYLSSSRRFSSPVFDFPVTLAEMGVEGGRRLTIYQAIRPETLEDAF